MKVALLIVVVVIGLTEATFFSRPGLRAKPVYPNAALYDHIQHAYSPKPAPINKPVHHARHSYGARPLYTSPSIYPNPFSFPSYLNTPAYSDRPYPLKTPPKPLNPLKPVYGPPKTYQTPAPLQPLDFSYVASNFDQAFDAGAAKPIEPVTPAEIDSFRYRVTNPVKPVYESQLEGHHAAKYHSGKPYNFAWSVQYSPFDNDYDHRESNDGRGVIGSYHVRLPDGRKQIVNYKANHLTGYVADVKYEGQVTTQSADAVHPTSAPVIAPLTGPVATTAALAAETELDESTGTSSLEEPAPEAAEPTAVLDFEDPSLVEPSAALESEELAPELAEPSAAPESLESFPDEEPSTVPELVEATSVSSSEDVVIASDLVEPIGVPEPGEPATTPQESVFLVIPDTDFRDLTVAPEVTEPTTTELVGSEDFNEISTTDSV